MGWRRGGLAKVIKGIFSKVLERMGKRNSFCMRSQVIPSKQYRVDDSVRSVLCRGEQGACEGRSYHH